MNQQEINQFSASEEALMIATAKKVLGQCKKGRQVFLAPQSEARVEWSDFDPCRPVQIIARVYWPATVSTANKIQDVTLCHAISDGDQYAV